MRSRDPPRRQGVHRSAAPTGSGDGAAHRGLWLGVEHPRQSQRDLTARPPHLCGRRARDRGSARARTGKGGDLRDGPPDRLRRVRAAYAGLPDAREDQGDAPLLVRHRHPARGRAEGLGSPITHWQRGWRSLRRDARYAASLWGLPLRVATFLWRARRHAVRSRDRFSLNSAIRPAEVVELLALARGRSAIVELGTGTGWSALVLALDDGGRRVVSYDPVVRAEREHYLAMVDLSVRERIDLRDEPDTSGPRS